MLAVLMFASPDAPGAKVVPTVGGTAAAYAPCHSLWYEVGTAMANLAYWEALWAIPWNQTNQTVIEQLAMARYLLSVALSNYMWHCGP